MLLVRAICAPMIGKTLKEVQEQIIFDGNHGLSCTGLIKVRNEMQRQKLDIVPFCL